MSSPDGSIIPQESIVKRVKKIINSFSKYNSSQKTAIFAFIALALVIPFTSLMIKNSTDSRSRAANQYTSLPVTPPTITSVAPSWGNAVNFPPPTQFSYGGYITVPKNLNLGNEFTIEGWYRPSDSMTTTQNLLTSIQFSGKLQDGIRIYHDKSTNKLVFSVSDIFGTIFKTQSTTSLQSNTWYYFSAEKYQSTLNLFINGISEGSISMQTSPDPLRNFTIGSCATTCFIGLLDEMRLSNISRRTFNKNFTVPTLPYTTDPATIALYHFDGNTGDAGIIDNSGNGNNGSFTGSVTFTLSSVGNHRPNSYYTTNPPFPVYGTEPLIVSFINQSTDSDGNPLIYSWDFGDGSISSEINPIHTFQITDNPKPSQKSFNAILKATDTFGESATYTNAITVYAAPNTPTPIPTLTPTPTPTPVISKISWSTPYAWLQADNFYIVANGKKFYGKPDPGTTVTLHSDPGNPTYTTLESIWTEQGVEMRLFIYFYADSIWWWSPEFRTYNGQSQGDWIYYYGRFFESKLGTPFIASVLDIPSAPPPANTYQGNIHFENLELRTFFQQPSPTSKPTPTPTWTPLPTVTLTPIPTATPIPSPTPVPNSPPVITTSVLPNGRIFRLYSTNVEGYDVNTSDSLTMSFSKLPVGLSQGPCGEGLDNQNRKTIRCVISGRPLQFGLFYVSVSLKDNQGAGSQKTLPLRISF